MSVALGAARRRSQGPAHGGRALARLVSDPETFPEAEGVDAVSSVTGAGVQPLLRATLEGLRRSRAGESPARVAPP